MSGLVIKAWKVDEQADGGACARIVGRESGLIAWFLSLLRVDPTTTLMVSPDRIEFTSASLAGTQSRILPLQSICSSYYGYHKPWKIALGIFAFCLAVAGSMHGGEGFVALIGLVIAFVYYFLNRELTLGFVENSGVVIGIAFKRSVIENIDVNEEQAKKVCTLVQSLIEKKGRAA